MTNTILIERLYRLYDPFYHLDCSFEQVMRQVLSLKTKEEPVYEPNYAKRSKNYDYGRIKYFYNQYNAGQKVDPITIDNNCVGMRIYPEPVIVDGHHRFIAAILAGVLKIKANYSGRIDLLRYLQGRRKTCP